MRTTFIVGFPGETDADFAELCDFVKAQRFDRVGVFTYCQEDGTPAATLPGQVPDAVKQERQQHLMDLQAEISRERLERWVGQDVPVLIDGQSEEHEWVMSGRMATQAPEVDGQVFLDTPPDDVAAGQIRTVKILQTAAHDLVGMVVA